MQADLLLALLAAPAPAAATAPGSASRSPGERSNRLGEAPRFRHGQYGPFFRETIVSDKFRLSLAPDQLWQAINPWSFYNQGAQLGFVNINLGQTPHPEIEQKLLDEVGSYGRQLGRIGDALEVLIDHAGLKDLNQAETDAFAMLKGQLAEIRTVKKRGHGDEPAV